MTIAWAYARVSGDEQADRGLPILGQKESFASYAAEHDLHLARIYVDEAISGKTDKRPDFQRMMVQALEDPQPPRVILLWSWSRFSRDQDDAHYWKAYLRRHAIEITDVSGEVPVVVGFEYVIESLIHWRDEQRLSEIGRDAKRGQQALARMGYIPTGVRPPPGYRAVTEERELEGRKRQLTRWAPDPATAPLVRRAWEMRLAGHLYHEIWRETRLFASHQGYTKFFANRVYIGEVQFGEVLIPVEALVTQEEWNRVAAMRSSHPISARRASSAYLLSGLLRCARCGRQLNGRGVPEHTDALGSLHHEQWRYVCTGRDAHVCDLRSFAAHPFEERVLEQLLSDVLTPQAIAHGLEDLERLRAQEGPQIQAKVDNLMAELDQVDAAIGRLLDAVERGGDAQSLTARLRQREAERSRLQAELGEARGLLDNAERATQQIEEVLTGIRTSLQRGDRSATQRLLRQIIEVIIVDNTTSTIHYRVPLPPTTCLQGPPPWRPTPNACLLTRHLPTRAHSTGGA